jgi:hypothetical protein
MGTQNIFSEKELIQKISATYFLMNSFCTLTQKHILRGCIGKNSISYIYIDPITPFDPSFIYSSIDMKGYVFYKTSMNNLTLVKESDIFYFSDQVRKAVKQKFKQQPHLLN